MYRGAHAACSPQQSLLRTCKNFPSGRCRPVTSARKTRAVRRAQVELVNGTHMYLWGMPAAVSWVQRTAGGLRAGALPAERFLSPALANPAAAGGNRTGWLDGPDAALRGTCCGGQAVLVRPRAAGAPQGGRRVCDRHRQALEGWMVALELCLRVAAGCVCGWNNWIGLWAARCCEAPMYSAQRAAGSGVLTGSSGVLRCKWCMCSFMERRCMGLQALHVSCVERESASRMRRLVLPA